MVGVNTAAQTNQSALTTIQMVSAPDIVIAALGGAFEGIQTMAEVPRDRVISSAVEYQHWNPKSHRYLCTSKQRASAKAVLLAAQRCRAIAVPEGSAPSKVTALPAMPNEIWFTILGWLRREELGSINAVVHDATSISGQQ